MAIRRAAVSLLALTILAGLTVLAPPTPASGQTLSDEFSRLFTFGDCGEALCLPVNEAVHGHHYIPAAVQGEANLLAFLSGAIAKSVGNLPATAASSGVTFTIVDGVPVQTSVSAGPIFAERAQTLGAGRFLVGANVSDLSFTSIRGTDLDELWMTFTHQNVASPALGDPSFENDMIHVSVDLNMDVLATNLFASYGVTDDLDVSVLVPLLRAELYGQSVATIEHFGDTSPHHFGTDTNPTDQATSWADGSTFGLGDVGLRAKASLYQTEQAGVGLLADVRLPTGDEADFLGSGEPSFRLLTVVSSRFGDFSPHVNTGFAVRGGDVQPNSLLLTVGFDQHLFDRATVAVELVSDFQTGGSDLRVPEPMQFSEPFPREVPMSPIPERDDDLVDASIGGKVDLPAEFRLLANALVPLNDGGLRPEVLWTVGLERTF